MRQICVEEMVPRLLIAREDIGGKSFINIENGMLLKHASDIEKHYESILSDVNEVLVKLVGTVYHTDRKNIYLARNYSTFEVSSIINSIKSSGVFLDTINCFFDYNFKYIRCVINIRTEINARIRIQKNDMISKSINKHKEELSALILKEIDLRHKKAICIEKRSFFNTNNIKGDI